MSGSLLDDQVFARFERVAIVVITAQSAGRADDRTWTTLADVTKSLVVVYRRDSSSLLKKLFRWRADLLTDPAIASDEATVDLTFCRAACFSLDGQRTPLSDEVLGFLKTFTRQRLQSDAADPYILLLGHLSRESRQCFEDIAHHLLDELHKRLRTDKLRLEAVAFARSVAHLHLEVGETSSVAFLRSLLEVFRESKVLELKHALMYGLATCLEQTRADMLETNSLGPTSHSAWAAVINDFYTKVSEWAKKNKHITEATPLLVALLGVAPRELFETFSWSLLTTQLKRCVDKHDERAVQLQSLEAIQTVLSSYLTNHLQAGAEPPELQPVVSTLFASSDSAIAEKTKTFFSSAPQTVLATINTPACVALVTQLGLLVSKCCPELGWRLVVLPLIRSGALFSHDVSIGLSILSQISLQNLETKHVAEASQAVGSLLSKLGGMLQIVTSVEEVPKGHEAAAVQLLCKTIRAISVVKCSLLMALPDLGVLLCRATMHSQPAVVEAAREAIAGQPELRQVVVEFFADSGCWAQFERQPEMLCDSLVFLEKLMQPQPGEEQQSLLPTAQTVGLQATCVPAAKARAHSFLKSLGWQLGGSESKQLDESCGREWDITDYSGFERPVMQLALHGACTACTRLWPSVQKETSSPKEGLSPMTLQWGHYVRFVCRFAPSEVSQVQIERATSLLASENNQIRAIVPRVVEAVQPDALSRVLSLLPQFDSDLWRTDQKLSSKTNAKQHAMRSAVALVYVSVATVATTSAAPSQSVRKSCLSMLSNVLHVVECAEQSALKQLPTLCVCVCQLSGVTTLAAPDDTELKSRLLCLLQQWCVVAGSEPTITPASRACLSYKGDDLSLQYQANESMAQVLSQVSGLPASVLDWVDKQLSTGSQVAMLDRSLAAMIENNRSLLQQCIERCFCRDPAITGMFTRALTSACSHGLEVDMNELAVIALSRLGDKNALVRQAAISLLAGVARAHKHRPWVRVSSSESFGCEIRCTQSVVSSMASDLGEPPSSAVVKTMLMRLCALQDQHAARQLLVCAAPFCAQLHSIVDGVDSAPPLLAKLMEVSRLYVRSYPHLVLELWRSLGQAAEHGIHAMVHLVLELCTDSELLEVATVAMIGLRTIDAAATIAALTDPFRAREASTEDASGGSDSFVLGYQQGVWSVRQLGARGGEGFSIIPELFANSFGELSQLEDQLIPGYSYALAQDLADTQSTSKQSTPQSVRSRSSNRPHTELALLVLPSVAQGLDDTLSPHLAQLLHATFMYSGDRDPALNGSAAKLLAVLLDTLVLRPASHDDSSASTQLCEQVQPLLDACEAVIASPASCSLWASFLQHTTCEPVAALRLVVQRCVQYMPLNKELTEGWVALLEDALATASPGFTQRTHHLLQALAQFCSHKTLAGLLRQLGMLLAAREYGRASEHLRTVVTIVRARRSTELCMCPSIVWVAAGLLMEPEPLYSLGLELLDALLCNMALDQDFVQDIVLSAAPLDPSRWAGLQPLLIKGLLDVRSQDRVQQATRVLLRAAQLPSPMVDPTPLRHSMLVLALLPRMMHSHSAQGELAAACNSLGCHDLGAVLAQHPTDCDQWVHCVCTELLADAPVELFGLGLSLLAKMLTNAMQHAPSCSLITDLLRIGRHMIDVRGEGSEEDAPAVNALCSLAAELAEFNPELVHPILDLWAHRWRFP
eukprot:TRINITY_DN20778_c0_g1_i1.p1 TRINITY_DN20778_c0_g1~~TRINITY_DN20778_c0_g1_i1.p1  ORF type:complete len:1681 (-),score=398.73 TRINITY_DN20778_c0_g1_i1:144-5186(-)